MFFCRTLNYLTELNVHRVSTEIFQNFIEFSRSVFLKHLYLVAFNLIIDLKFNKEA